jgi:predicted DNA-binding transcriptional regulator YafY
MNRVDRLFNILLILQRRKKIRAEDLAQELEISKRTVYRDLSALSEMGVPLVAIPGEGYALVEGFYLPPLSFSAEEAAALFLGARMLAAQASGQLAKTAATATEKIAQVVPENTRRKIEEIVDPIHFYGVPETFDLSDTRLVQIREAIEAHHPLLIHYFSYSQGEFTQRIVEPDYLSYSDGAWYLSAYCRLRQDERVFRVDRIEYLKVLPETFQPKDTPPDEPSYTQVRVRFLQETLRWVRERQHYGYVEDEKVLKNGDTIMVYQVERLSEIQPWLLRWGAKAEVLSPPDLRKTIREEAEKLLALLT